MSNPDPVKPRGRVASGLMMIAGGLLLLPGLCVVITAMMTLGNVVPVLWEMLTSDRRRDPGAWLVFGMWAVLWVICLAISYGGLKLIQRASRR